MKPAQRYALLSDWKNLDQEDQQSLKELLRVNHRLHKAYLLKEQSVQLWDYYRPEWARKFFAKWKASLRWQRLPDFEKFEARMEKHWKGIFPYAQKQRPFKRISLKLISQQLTGLNCIAPAWICKTQPRD